MALILYMMFGVYGIFCAAYLVYSLYRKCCWKQQMRQSFYVHLSLSVLCILSVFIFDKEVSEFSGYGLPYLNEFFSMLFIFGFVTATSSLPIVWLMHKLHVKGKWMYVLSFVVTYSILYPIVSEVSFYISTFF